MFLLTRAKPLSGISPRYCLFLSKRDPRKPSSCFSGTRFKARRNNGSQINNAGSDAGKAGEASVTESTTNPSTTVRAASDGTGNANGLSGLASGSALESETSMTKLELAGRMVGMFIVLPAIPIGMWWYQTVKDREKHAHEVKTKVRIPNVQTLDEIMIDKMQPGDVLLFDRKCDKCAAGPLQAAACILSKAALCGQSTHAYSDSSTKLDHVGVVVPGINKHNDLSSKTTNNKSFDEGKDLLLLEVTPNGVVARPLLERLEMSRARTVLLLPLAAPLEKNRRKEFDTVPTNDLLYEDDEPNENDNRSSNGTVGWFWRLFGNSKQDDDIQSDDRSKSSSYVSDEDDKTLRAKLYVRKQLIQVRDSLLVESEKISYGRYHSIIGLSGAAAYALGVEEHSPSPVSPSAWLVVTALQQAGVAMKIEKRAALDAKPEDFLRDSRFHENDVVRLRPGWKFLPPVILRETSKSL